MEQQTVVRTPNYGAPAWLILLLGILLGAAGGVLLYFGLIPDVTSILIAMIVFALFVILLLIILLSQTCGVYCLRKYVPWIIISALMLLSFAIYSLGVVFVSGSILLAVLFFVISTFFFMTVFGVQFTILCLLR